MISISKFFFILIISLLSINGVSSAKIEILVSVNDEIITNHDVKKETNYLKLLNPQLEELGKKKIYELAKTSLINEIIKKKEISKFFNSNKLRNKFVDEQLNNIIRKLNYKDKEKFIKELKNQNTYSIDEIKDKINVELSWNEIIFKRFDNQVKINIDDIEKKVNSFKNIQQQSFLLSEIVFKLQKNENFSDKLNNINSSISQIGFENSANIYSLSDSSKYGGDIGWIKESSLAEEINELIRQLKIGEISKPIKINNNFLILKVRDKKIEKISIDFEQETKKLIDLERNRQLNQFSKIFFDKSKMNYSIYEK